MIDFQKNIFLIPIKIDVFYFLKKEDSGENFISLIFKIRHK